MNDITSSKTWLPHIAPQTILTLSGLFIFIVILVSTYIAMSLPSTGIKWIASEVNTPGLIIEKIYGHQDSDKLQVGNRIISLSADEKRIMLHSTALIEEPDLYSTLKEYNQFFTYQHQIHEVLSKGSIVLHRDDGVNIELDLQKTRPISQLPLAYWIDHFSAMICFFIGIGVWAYRRNNPSARLLALSGLGYFCGIACLAIYSTRELALDAHLFRILTELNHFFMIVFAYTLWAIFWFYPRHLGGKCTVTILFLLGLMVWLNQTMQWIEIPFHPFYFLTFVIPYTLAIPLAILQRAKTQNAVERAALRWFFLSTFLSIGFAIAVLVLPGIHGISVAMPLWVPTVIVAMMFGGLAFGILRYRLFDLERWWFGIWAWFLSGSVIVVIDSLLIYVFHFTPGSAIFIAVLIVGWIYFPIRQRLWQHWLKNSSFAIENNLPMIVGTFFSEQSIKRFGQEWNKLLQSIFKPNHIAFNERDNLSNTLKQPVIHDHGNVLLIPISAHQCVKLIGKNYGRQLFTKLDIQLAQTINTLAQQSYDLHQAHEKGAQQERQRIARDLHDGAKGDVLTLKQIFQNPSTYNIPEIAKFTDQYLSDSARQRFDTILKNWVNQVVLTTSQLADSANESIADAIYNLENDATLDIDSLFDDWQIVTRAKLCRNNIELSWQSCIVNDTNTIISSHNAIQIQRILSECITNILRHSSASMVDIKLNLEDGLFTMRIRDNGGQNNCSFWQSGSGMKNLSARAKKIRGSISWHETTEPDEPGVCVELQCRI